MQPAVAENLGGRSRIIQVLRKKGRTLDEQLAIFRDLPKTQQNPDTERSLTKALAEAGKQAGNTGAR